MREHEDAGLVQVVFGEEGGLSEESFGVHSPRQERGDTGFGAALAVGDIDGDGYEDVAISNGDHVTVLWGRSGLNGGGDDPSVSSFFATTSVDDEVSALELADVTGNGHLDLVTVSDHERAGDGGELLLFPGNARGLSTEAANEPISLTGQGAQVAAGDINDDGYADVVITHADGDAARILEGSQQGLTGQGLTLDSDLGSDSVAVGDIDGDGYADIVLGDTTVQDPDGGADAGGVDVLYGGPDWVDGREQSFVQGSDGVAGASEAGDRMGAAVTLVDLNGDDLLDLVVGVPGENDGNGAITILYADAEGLSGVGSQTFGGSPMGLDGSGAEFGHDLS
ncbi:VCBS repeat-containing protein [Nocardiopsis sp. MG754419]|uniref:FG-GAP repeat domain-containing protein n=1 Tax=Nocardiopsis sp. MG754419 TaxID=2259865 RepID=UPI0027DBA6CF|nr:VCBS repeat-containing protein [Nocardiopsis sp. MG754419]